MVVVVKTRRDLREKLAESHDPLSPDKNIVGI